MTVYKVGVSFILSSILLFFIINFNSKITTGILPDFMSFERLYKRIFSTINIVLLALFVTACSITAPVQEMSNARQSIRAAQDANAEKLAANVLSEAKQRLRSAMRELDAGEYEKARILALEAKHLAVKARQLAVGNKAD